MMRKIKFGLNLGDIVVATKKENNVNKENIVKSNTDNQLVCSICQETNLDKIMCFVNCKLKGIKYEQIGRYKDCDKTMCLKCIEKCEEINVGSEVMFKYTITKKNRRRLQRRTSFYTVQKKGTIVDVASNGNIIINSGDWDYILKEKNIMYKCNTCPWCRSHELHHWKIYKETYPKIKKSKR